MKRFSASDLVGVDERGSRVARLELEARQHLNQRSQGRGGGQSGLRVHDPDLDGAQPGLGADVPPQESRLGDRSRAEKEVERLDPVPIVLEAPGDAGPGEALEQDRAVGGQAGRLAAQERRAGRQREQHRQMGTQTVDQPDRAGGIGHAHMHVERERRLTAGQAPHRAVDDLVATRGRDPGRLGSRAGIHARGGGGQAQPVQIADQQGAQFAQLRDRLAHGLVRCRPQLEGGLVGLCRTVPRETLAGLGENLVSPLAQGPVGRVEEHDLFLDPDRVGL